MKSSNQMRVLLDENAYHAIEAMIEELKAQGDYLKINPSRLASWVINRFHRDGFKKAIPQICQDHFNSKEYLKNLAAQVDGNENAAALLTEALAAIKSKNRAVPTSAKSKKEKPPEESQP